MNIEKTMEFILDSQAKTEERFTKFQKTIEFILDNQAKIEERFAKADGRFAKSERRLDRIERVLAQTNRVVAGLARSGVSLRSDVRTLQKFRVRTEENLAEITDKLIVLIDIVDKSHGRNGSAR